MKRFSVLTLGITSAALITTTALTGVSAQAAPGQRFGQCPQDISSAHPDLQCSSVPVPLDYRAPHGQQIQLTVSRAPARKPATRKGVLVTNPGGPGSPGATYAGSLADALPADVRDSYDIVGFDTRNTGHSSPITCVDPATYWKNPLPDPDSPRTRETHWNRAQQYADGCQQRAGTYLPHLNTENNARDMERIRTALGEQKISFLGYSYGTYLGAAYGEMFADRVDRMILDSSVNPNPSEVWYRNNLNQDFAAQARLDLYFDWIARHDSVLHLGTTREQVRAAWQAVQDDLRKRPRGTLGPWEYVEMTMSSLYSESNWTPLAKAIGSFRRGDDKPLIEKVSVKDAAAETSNAVYNAVECADAPWPTRRAEWERDSSEIAEHAPLAAWYNSWGIAPCAMWPGPRNEPLKITGRGLPPVLMFNSVHDIATPYEGAQEMHRSLPSSVLVTEQNAGKHGVFGLAENNEADRIGADYLVRGALPRGDRDIAGHALPDPAKPEAAQSPGLP